MYKILEQNNQATYGISTYAADSIEDLPKSAKFGDKAIFKDGKGFNIAIHLSEGWEVPNTSTGGDSGGATDEEIMDAMAEMELIEPVSLLDGSILISNKNEIYSL